LIALLAIALGIALPFLVQAGFFAERALIDNNGIVWLMPIYYCFCIPAGTALYALERLLAAVRPEQVFTPNNVPYLRLITWCCFVAGIILLASSLVSVVFFTLAIMAAFFGVILRVVKNLFAAAVALQNESDYTI
jgi:hypothetical protein